MPKKKKLTTSLTHWQTYLVNFWQQKWFVVATIILGVVASWACLSHLDWTQLAPFDEAWYGSIARTLARDHDWYFVKYNGGYFTDHPPLGFWLMAIAYQIGGVSEFTTRLPSALAGIGSVILLCLIGRQWKMKSAGVMAGAMLLSAMWFLFRARTGNLDIPLVFFYLLAIFSFKQITNNRWWLPVAGLSIAAALTVKTLVGFSLLPILGIIFIAEVRKWRISVIPLSLGLAAVWLLGLPWYWQNSLADQEFINHHFFEIGLRSNSIHVELTLARILQTLEYLQSGVGLWFKPIIASLAISPVIFLLNKKMRWLIVFNIVWIAVIGWPFFKSTQTEIWHLIPLYPALFLLTATTINQLAAGANWLLSKYKFNQLRWQKIGRIGITVAIWLIVIGQATKQLLAVSNLVIPKQKEDFAQAEIARAAHQFDWHTTVYLKDAWFPTAVFYADRKIENLGIRPDAMDVMTRNLAANTNAVYIVPNGDLAELEKLHYSYRVWEQNHKYTIIGPVELNHR